jgi:hypothetical protein
MEETMPFADNWHDRRGDALEKIDKVIALLRTEDKWCKFFALSGDGRRCLWGAIWAEDAASILEPPILDAIRQVTGRYHRCIDAFNDDPATTHTLVLKVLHQARHTIRLSAPYPAHQHDIGAILRGSLATEGERLALGKELQRQVDGRSVMLEGVR